MWALRTEPELILKSRWAVPERLTAAGYRIAHPDLEEALRDCIRPLSASRRRVAG